MPGTAVPVLAGQARVKGQQDGGGPLGEEVGAGVRSRRCARTRCWDAQVLRGEGGGRAGLCGGAGGPASVPARVPLPRPGRKKPQTMLEGRTLQKFAGFIF